MKKYILTEIISKHDAVYSAGELSSFTPGKISIRLEAEDGSETIIIRNPKSIEFHINDHSSIKKLIDKF